MCESCEHRHDEFLWFSEKLPKKCPKCGAKSPHYHQDYMQNRPCGISYGNPTTFGQQAEINAKRMGKEQLQKMGEKERAKRRGFTGKRPEGARSVLAPTTAPAEPEINLDKIHDVEKYIMTGEM